MVAFARAIACVGCLAAARFAPEIGLQVRLWREYGSNRPYAVFIPQTQKPERRLTFYPLCFH
jgi:hypothetical protein